MVVGVVYGIEQFSGLWEESSDFSVVPTRKDALAIGGEEDAVAFEAWYLDSQKLLSSLGVPHSNVIQAASCKELRVAHWESNVIDSLVVTSVSQFWIDVICVAPVDCGL